jgi:hypothetical protein
MDQNTDQLKDDIERRREDIGETLDAIGDRVIPGRIIERRREQLRYGVSGVRDRVMGTAHEISDAASAAGDQLGPEAVSRQVSGHPLGAGLVAAGLGFLVAAAIPRTQAEVQLAESISDAAAPIREQAEQAVREVGQSIADDASHAAAELKERAATAAADLTDTAQQAANETRDELRH